MQLALHLLVLLAFPPLLLGVIGQTKAAIAGRRGAGLLQPYFDLARLLRKGMVVSTTTTWIFLAAPVVALGCGLLAALLVPLGPLPALISFPGDFLVLVYLYGLARFFTTAAALDTGSPFEGMGAAREVTFGFLTEPALLLALLVFARLSGALSVTLMARDLWRQVWPSAAASLVLVAVALFVLLLAENCRVPVDDPATHLELTMIHEVMVLDHSGPLLALIHYAAALKLFVFSALLLRVVAPWSTGSIAGDWGFLIAGTFVIAIAVGLVESTMARLKLREVPTLLLAAGISCFFGFLLVPSAAPATPSHEKPTAAKVERWSNPSDHPPHPPAPSPTLQVGKGEPGREVGCGACAPRTPLGFFLGLR